VIISVRLTSVKEVRFYRLRGVENLDLNNFLDKSPLLMVSIHNRIDFIR
jgi:hypothetical protein